MEDTSMFQWVRAVMAKRWSSSRGVAQILVKSEFNQANTFHMRESTLDTEAGRTLLPTQGQIHVKNGNNGVL